MPFASLPSPFRHCQPLEPRLFLSAVSLEDFIPMTPRSTRTYDVTDDGEAYTQKTRLAPRKVRVNGLPTRVLQTRRSNADHGEEFVSLTDDGYRFHRQAFTEGRYRTSLTSSPPIVQIPLEFDIGEVFNDDARITMVSKGKGLTDVSEGPLHATFRAVRLERVTVPAGTFRCLRAKMTLKFNLKAGSFESLEGQDVQDIWLAKGIGPVKVVSRATMTRKIGTIVLNRSNSHRVSLLRAFNAGTTPDTQG